MSDLVQYDKHAFERAYQRMHIDPLALSPADFDQLEIAGDPALVTKAFAAQRAAQLALVPSVPAPAARRRKKSAADAEADWMAEIIAKADQMADIIAMAIKVAVTPVVARVQVLEQRQHAGDQSSLRDAGTWSAGKKYLPGDCVAFRGRLFGCLSAHIAVGPAVDAACWREFPRADEATP